MGKETEIEVPLLPIAKAQGLEGYHASQISTHIHTLFEEVPSPGVAADCVMAVATNVDDPAPNVSVGKPTGSVFTPNLAGYIANIGPQRVGIRQRLTGQCITANAFPEYTPDTRFILKYMLSLSNLIGKCETFRLEKLNVLNMTLGGGGDSDHTN
jgi:hypothetical protein